MKRVKAKKFFNLVAVLLMAIVLMTPVYADASEGGTIDAVNTARKGVLQIRLEYLDQASTLYTLGGGSGFLIGETNGAEYMVTNYHVVALDEATRALATQEIGVDFASQSVLNQVQIKVVVKRDVKINATVVNFSEEMDFAILKLEQPIYDRESLILNSAPDNSKDSAPIYALGFPAAVEALEDSPLYTSENVNVSDGIISNNTTINDVEFIRHNVVLSGGNSGGPLVNSKGQVIGINTMGLVDTDYNYSLQIREVTSILDALGITYRNVENEEPQIEEAPEDTEPAGEVAVVETEPAVVVDKVALATAIATAEMMNLEEYTEESAAALTSALGSGKAVNENVGATQADVDAAAAAINAARENLVEDSGMSTMLIIAIVAGILIVVIIAIVIILVVSGKKNKKQVVVQPAVPVVPAGASSAAPATAPTAPPHQPAKPMGYSGFGRSEGSGETSVLNQGSGETSVLGNSAPQMTATLRRVKNNETIQINKQLFKIGKERVRVDYCIPDNNSISRVHAQIVFKNNAYYLMDMKSTNYTYINGNKAIAEQDMKLNNGDKIRLADEEFEFKC